ncbi:hypothetical protein HQ585_15105 [candidate division KSB1 bacterium]|nr:hypothetical protein [candidate division KSB1 bacterium]
MLAPIIITVLAIVLTLLFMKVAMGDFLKGGSGGSTNVFFGATNDLLSHDQKRAAEVIVKKDAGEKEEEQESGEPEIK